MFKSGVKETLQARHFLRGDFDEESVPHSHPYEVELIGETEGLNENGFSMDIALMEKTLRSVLEEIDDVLLNDLPFFSDRQPSLENLCLYLWKACLELLKKSSTCIPTALIIRIWESPTAWASYSGKVE
jgi:6-pyruvoyltetrahydropterin/6-carboxytetrahydropterin synthase